MIVEPDVNIGSKLADWLTAHDCQAVAIESVEAAIEELSDIRPQLVFVSGGHSEPAAEIEISEITQLIRTVCPGVPMITIADRPNEDMAQVMFCQGVHHVLGKPVRSGSIKRP
jgi:DNA-binding NtrC family response regulator